MNTLFFMGAICILFYQTDYIQSLVTSFGASNALAFVIAFVGFNGLVEALASFIAGTAIAQALLVVMRRSAK